MNNYESRAKIEMQLDNDLKHSLEKMQEYEQELTSLEEQIHLRELAIAEQSVHTSDLNQLKSEREGLLTKQLELEKNHEQLNKTTDELAIEISRIEGILHSHNESELMEQMENIKQKITIYRDYISQQQMLQQVEEKTKKLTAIRNEQKMREATVNDLQTFLNDMGSITKINVLQDNLKAIGFIPSQSINEKTTELTKVIESIRLNLSSETYLEWIELINRLNKAIEAVSKLLSENGLLKQSNISQGVRKPSSVKEIHNQIDKVGHFLINPSVKKALQSKHYSAERYEYLEKLSITFDVLSKKKNYAHSQIANVETSKSLFKSIKAEVNVNVNQTISKMNFEIDELKKNENNLEVELTKLRERSSILINLPDSVENTISIQSMEDELFQLETTYSDVEKTISSCKQYFQDLEHSKKTVESNAQVLKDYSKEIQLTKERIEESSKKCNRLEEQLRTLKEVVDQNPKEQHEHTLSSMAKLSRQIKEFEKEKVRFPITNALQKEWLSLLKAANEHDLDEIRKLYVQHANVIGTTCVASARRDFMEEYPVFDVVIIDEVSKATPPELLLPMLKGKKIILVGDHHQLPPLVGQETLEEFLEESVNQQEKVELKKLLEESLFERLFRTLPKQNKTMLGIQYRMHETIMETITPFYADGDYRLQCGITDSNVERNHGVESRYVKSNDHLLWFDMPNEPNYFENKVTGGTSRYNQSELTMVKKLLIDLDESVGKTKDMGIMNLQFKKSVGVISFYGEQVKRIDRLIQQELMPQHLHCRTGSVDKFQGMEMDIIILSFVRNHKDKSGDIGFARDYRRLNVALSRARELLIIVGSAEMFAVRTKDMKARKMYSRLVADIKEKNGFRKHE